MRSGVVVYNGQRQRDRQSVPRDNTTHTMNTKILIVLAMAALAAADSREAFSYAAPRDSSEESYESSEAQYNFNYAVKDDSSDNDFGHQETRDGDDTQGSYYVQLPDGRLQTVTYVVDGDSGYIADVKYDGEARYPDSDESFESREAPRYAPPRPSYFDSNESK
ncbi:cuticle protein 7-like [Homarus americanus]|uniref:cuticle protein 7-like n=1 Tax=Homarus americanus TaxID=6706 RepID=UPI001C441931|nr:cuticle protein 7-like [Homarus americanus]